MNPAIGMARIGNTIIEATRKVERIGRSANADTSRLRDMVFLRLSVIKFVLEIIERLSFLISPHKPWHTKDHLAALLFL
jgi:hypothetical protein